MEDKWTRLILAVPIVMGLVYLAAIVTVVYIVAHFVMKWW